MATPIQRRWQIFPDGVGRTSATTLEANIRFMEYVILNCIGANPITERGMVLKGGNALRFAFQSPRSTKDLDFTVTGDEIPDDADRLRDLLSFVTPRGENVSDLSMAKTMAIAVIQLNSCSIENCIRRCSADKGGGSSNFATFQTRRPSQRAINPEARKPSDTEWGMRETAARRSPELKPTIGPSRRSIAAAPVCGPRQARSTRGPIGSRKAK